MLPPIFRTFFNRRKPATPKCTDQNINALLGRIISHENNSQLETITRDMMPDRYRRAEGDDT
jgi:hypothetical protein